MKKLITALVLLGVFVNVQAFPEKTCSSSEISKGQTDLRNVTHVLEYMPEYIDMNGDFEESHLKITFPNLPNGYIAIVNASDGLTLVKDSSDYAVISGGVYSVDYYSNECSTIIKSYEFMAPHYKQYCELNGNCKENVFFDGTYENTSSNQNKNIKNKVSTKLIVILIILLLVIVIFVVVIIKRRRSYEKDF